MPLDSTIVPNGTTICLQNGPTPTGLQVTPEDKPPSWLPPCELPGRARRVVGGDASGLLSCVQWSRRPTRRLRFRPPAGSDVDQRNASINAACSASAPSPAYVAGTLCLTYDALEDSEMLGAALGGGLTGSCNPGACARSGRGDRQGSRQGSRRGACGWLASVAAHPGVPACSPHPPRAVCIYNPAPKDGDTTVIAWLFDFDNDCW